VVDELIEDNLTEDEADALVRKLNNETDCYIWYKKKLNELLKL